MRWTSLFAKICAQVAISNANFASFLFIWCANFEFLLLYSSKRTDVFECLFLFPFPVIFFLHNSKRLMDSMRNDMRLKRMVDIFGANLKYAHKKITDNKTIVFYGSWLNWHRPQLNQVKKKQTNYSDVCNWSGCCWAHTGLYRCALDRFKSYEIFFQLPQTNREI